MAAWHASLHRCFSGGRLITSVSHHLTSSLRRSYLERSSLVLALISMRGRSLHPWLKRPLQRVNRRPEPLKLFSVIAGVPPAFPCSHIAAMITIHFSRFALMCGRDAGGPREELEWECNTKSVKLACVFNSSKLSLAITISRNRYGGHSTFAPVASFRNHLDVDFHIGFLPTESAAGNRAASNGSDYNG